MKNTLSILLILVISVSLFGQNKRTKPFNLIITENIIENSLYNNIELLDSRLDKENFGYVQTGMFNNYAYMVDEIPFAKQLDSLMNKITDQTARQKTLLLQLRNLNFSEITKSTSETGYCHIRISLYEKDHPDYYLVSTLDTLFQVKAMDVTGKLLKNSSNLITSFIAANLTNERSDERPFLLADIHNIDFFEKNDLKVYSADKLLDGIYPDFRSFADQTPVVEEMTTKYDKENNLTEIKIPDPQKNKLKKLNPKDIYAVVIAGQPYITSSKSYIPVYKDEDNELRFINDGNIKLNVQAYVGAGIAAGIVAGFFGGVAFFPVNSSPEKVEMTIDHMTGDFIILPRKSEINIKEPAL